MSFLDKTIALGGASGFGGAWLWSERIGGELMAAVMVMAGTFLLSALAWRAELWCPRSAYRSAARAAPRREKVAAPVVALLLLSTAVGSPVATVAAASSTEECSGVDALLYDMVTVGEYSLADKQEHPCSPRYQRAQAIEELKNASAQQEKLDIYNAAIQQRANDEVFTDVSDNYLNDSRSVAWMHAETAIANAYANGSSKAVARSKAKSAIADYYATKQVNLIERWNVTIQGSYTLQKVAENQTGISDDYVDAMGSGSAWEYSYDSFLTKTGSQSVGLVNGSSAPVTSVTAKSGNSEGGFSAYLVNDPGADDGDVKFDGIVVRAPNSNYEDKVLVRFSNYESRWDRIETLNSDLQSEVDPFVNATWTAFQSGEIRASDVISRNNLMFRYGTDAVGNDNSSLYDNTAALATMGLSSPNLSSTGSMTVEYEGVTYTGMVLAQEAPNGSWQAGTTYNTSNIGGTVLLATTSGERIDMKGEFTLQAMKNQDGDDIQETQATKVVYKTSNTSELLAKMDRIIELREQIESTKPKAGGGGTTSDGSSLLDQLAALLGISAGAAAVVLVGVGVLVFKFYSP